ncbi:MAG: YebC/PmpR family DNA-binding transcriptional regulator [Acholeplasmatales bacterium]|jgi:YebC/PmpR family DNA-binding regulatory protein|nr:YebC/PmpR family DNA-binding transcriptional regulator [Acholeplasmatales bacterium]
MGRAHEVRAASMAKTAAVKSKLYAKWAKEIYMAAKSGVPDPDMNAGLKRIIERAKKEQVTADVIKRSIEKASGVKGGNFSEIQYEGRGPAGTSVIVDCLTDNVNRTVGSVRTAFTKCGGTFGAAVGFQFEHKAVVSVEGFSEEEVLEALIMNDIDADTQTEDNIVTVTGQATDYSRIKDALTTLKEDLDFEDSEVTYLPTTYVELTDSEDIRKFKRFIGMLEEIEDVQDYYHNAQYDDSEEEE